MHDCPSCGDACGCDGEAIWKSWPANLDCEHECPEPEDTNGEQVLVLLRHAHMPGEPCSAGCSLSEVPSEWPAPPEPEGAADVFDLSGVEAHAPRVAGWDRDLGALPHEEARLREVLSGSGGAVGKKMLLVDAEAAAFVVALAPAYIEEMVVSAALARWRGVFRALAPRSQGGEAVEIDLDERTTQVSADGELEVHGPSAATLMSRCWRKRKELEIERDALRAELTTLRNLADDERAVEAGRRALRNGGGGLPTIRAILRAALDAVKVPR